MGHESDRDADGVRHAFTLTRRTLLQSALTSGGIGMAARSPAIALAGQRPQDDKTRAGSPSCALAMARLLNRPRFGDLPPMAIEHAKVLVASTLASAAAGFTPGKRIEETLSVIRRLDQVKNVSELTRMLQPG